MTVCKRCVMSDEGDSTIVFNDDGVCNYCTAAFEKINQIYFPNDTGARKLDKLIHMLKKEGQGKEFDCLMGLSGGLDSSYLAYLGAAKWGLRIAAVHVDDGYDTEISKSNLKKLIEKTGVAYIEIRPEAEAFNSLTLAFMKAGVPNLAMPQDNVLFATLYDFAKRKKIKYFLSGSNFATESILQRGNTWGAFDVTNIKDINRRFGTKSIDDLIFMTNLQKAKDSLILGLKTFCPLNFVSYTRVKAFDELDKYCGFQYYGRKHLENHLTAFLQTCWLPERFGADKRRSHLSSLIVSGQITRDEALTELEEPQYDDAYMHQVKALMAERMGITPEEIDSMIRSPIHQHNEYKIDRLNKICSDIYKRFIE